MAVYDDEHDDETPLMSSSNDEGFSLVEAMVALVLVSVGLLALASEFVAYLHNQAQQRSRASAVHLVSSSIEATRRLTPTTLASLPPTSTVPITVGGRTYTQTTQVLKCSLSDPDGSCTAPSSSAVADTRVAVTVTWPDGGRTRSVTGGTTVADTSTSPYTRTGAGTLSGLVGGASSGSVAVSAFTSSPSAVTVSSAGTPSSGVTLSLTTVGLTGASSVPVTWTDDAGSHQISMTGGPNSWSATIPAASLSKHVSSGTSTLVFAATVPGTSTLPQATVAVFPSAWFTSCSVTPAPVLLAPLTRKTAVTETLTCSTGGLTAADQVSVSYPSGSGTATKSLTTSNGGSTWSVTLAAGTSMANGIGLTEVFTFSLTRASDAVTASTAVTAVLA